MPIGSVAPSFDLTRERWLPVQHQDGHEEVSLREIFTRADELDRLVGDVPTQEFALLRVLLAIVHDAIEGPEDLDEWQELWDTGLPTQRIHAYLDQHHERFNLLDPDQPFFQTPGLQTTRGDMTSLDRLVADVPNGQPFFTMRVRGVDRLSFAEAARWVVHAHAFDTSGIKTGVVGDPLVKGGKAYPQGVAWAGRLGGVLIEGANLRQTLLLNLIAFDTGNLRMEVKRDCPAWRRPPTGPGKTDELELAQRPTGIRDLYTWQSRRVRLAFDTGGVFGAILSYGDPLDAPNMHQQEPMTGWRRSETQEKKLGLPEVYMPREHNRCRSAWRGLGVLIAGRAPGAEQRKEAASIVRPRILDWVARLAVEDRLPLDLLIHTRLVGAEYGTQQSVFNEIIDDRVAMPLVLLYERDRGLGQVAVDAVDDAENAVTVLADFAADLARAAGAEVDPAREAARSSGFSTLDAGFRDWLARISPLNDPHERRAAWQRDAHRLLSRLADELLRSAGDDAWDGRVMEVAGRPFWLNSSWADWTFRSRLRVALPAAGGTAISETAQSSGQSQTGRGGTITTTSSDGHGRTIDLVGGVAGAYISELQQGYLRGESWAVGTLAHLRRGAGKLPQEVPNLWGMCGTERLYEDRYLSQNEAVRAEAALFLAVTLYALHQQSRLDKGMHQAGTELGEAVRRLMPADSLDESIRRRFVRVGTAITRGALANRLREIVMLLRRGSIPLDYVILAQQLYLAQYPDGMRCVRQRWGRGFHLYRLGTAAAGTGTDNVTPPRRKP